MALTDILLRSAPARVALMNRVCRAPGRPPQGHFTFFNRIPRAVSVVDAGTFLRDAELAAERLSAIVRLVIFFPLLSLVMATKINHHHEVIALWTMAAYGAVAVIALVLAWRRLFHPVLPFAYVTFDVALVCLSILLINRMLDFPPPHGVHGTGVGDGLCRAGACCDALSAWSSRVCRSACHRSDGIRHRSNARAGGSGAVFARDLPSGFASVAAALADLAFL